MLHCLWANKCRKHVDNESERMNEEKEREHNREEFNSQTPSYIHVNAELS
jgi:hypothetical protein